MNIGIVGKVFEAGIQNSFGITTNFFNYFSEFGEPFVISPHNFNDEDGLKRLLDFTDLLILPGGADVSFNRYKDIAGEKLNVKTGFPDPFLEYFDLNLLPHFVNARKPIVGICRGIQTLNVYFGGSLHQHIFHPYSLETIHRVYSKKVERGNSGKSMFKVNSLHHQAINIIGKDLVPLLFSIDGIVEAIRHETLPIFAVQFHPELLDEIEDCVKWTSDIIRSML